jgi:hypothetical protein
MHRLATALTLLVAASSCAHGYYYTPEIAGEGAMFRQGTIAFHLPPTDPTIKMKLLCLGIGDAPQAAAYPRHDKMLQIRFYILRSKEISSAPQEYIDADDVRIVLAGKHEVKPALVHASIERADKHIGLSPSKRQVIEMFFPLPHSIQGPDEVQAFNLDWKIHLNSTQVVDEVTRFDRQDSRPQQGAELFPGDADFPYDFSPELTPGWTVDPWPWRWWDPFPA